MAEYDQILKVKEDAEARLRTIPGVHAVGISRKVVGGETTEELCITVFLSEKKPLDRLAPEEVVPAEIDGVKTDVVAMEMPRLLAADPANLRASVSADRLSVTFTGRAKPGDGLVVVLFFTPEPSGEPPGTLNNVSLETASWMTLDDVADRVAGAANAVGAPRFTATATGAQVTLAPAPGDVCAIHCCTVGAIDDRRYFEDYIRGGIQIAPGNGSVRGTLGCLATTHGKVVAITCQHVVAPLAEQATNLIAVCATPDYRITFSRSGTAPILPGTLVVVELNILRQSVFYRTLNGDMPFTVANSLASTITTLGTGGPRASVTTPTPSTAVLNLDGDTISSYGVYGPSTPDPHSDLRATVVGLAIDLRGEVSGDDYGIFTNVNPGGIHPTIGVYTHPERGATLSAIAQAIAQSISNLPLRVRGSVTAVASGARVTVSNAQEIECIIESDIQIGQPDNSFGSTCLHCCSHRIGRLLDARIEVDVALVQLDAGKKYKPMINDRLLTGTHAVQPSDLGLTVSKRGRTTGLTQGKIRSMNVSGQIAEATAFHREYADAVVIGIASPTSAPFALPGDSGSAVSYNDQVVGILFGVTAVTAMITPIEQITAAFASLALDFAPAPAAGHTPEEVRTVPTSAMAASEPLASPLDVRLVQAEREIAATPAGSEVAAVVRRHLPEAHHLVNSNRRAATVWQRNGGPRILEAVLRALYRRGQRLPEEIEGRPLAECLERIERGLARYASPEFAADLSRFTPRLASFSGLTYAQMLATLGGGAAEPVRPLEPVTA